MAFVYKTKRVHPSEFKKHLPGPADYLGPNAYTFEPNNAPFLSKSTRVEKSNHPSVPRLANFDSVVQNSAKMILQGDSSPWENFSQDWLKKEEPKATSSFMTKADRYSYLDIKKTPGPGNYLKLSNPIKKTRFQPSENNTHNTSQKMITRNKSVPSIPSHKHSHGYSEAVDGALILNEEPIEEVQELPGERCHDMGKEFHQKKATKRETGSWAKSSSKDVASYIHRGATFDSAIGPGSYQVPDPSLPNTGRGSVGFTSTTDRASYTGQRMVKPPRNSSYRASVKYQAATARDSVKFEHVYTNGDDSEDEDDEFVKDATPGPGYYYNASTASSFKSKLSSVKSRNTDDTRSRRSRVPGVGSRSPRFTERGSASLVAGPGDYNVAGDILKRDISHKGVPFFSGNKRFVRERLSENPGPGAYEIKSEVLKSLEKSKSNASINGLGGNTDRFNNAKESADYEHLGPGTYDPRFTTDIINELGENPRPSAIFIAKNQRGSLPNEQAPPPGSYTVKNYDIGIKIIREEEEAKIFGLKKVPFGVAKSRFNDTAQDKGRYNDDEDDDLNWAPIKSVSSLLQSNKPGAPSAAFASKSKRLNPISRGNMNPGPGSYHAAALKGWNKQTFNVNFLGI